VRLLTCLELTRIPQKWQLGLVAFEPDFESGCSRVKFQGFGSWNATFGVCQRDGRLYTYAMNLLCLLYRVESGYKRDCCEGRMLSVLMYQTGKENSCGWQVFGQETLGKLLPHTSVGTGGGGDSCCKISFPSYKIFPETALAQMRARCNHISPRFRDLPSFHLKLLTTGNKITRTVCWTLSCKAYSIPVYGCSSAFTFKLFSRKSFSSTLCGPPSSSRSWVDSVPDLLRHRKSGTSGSLSRDLWISGQEL
jgi:hypothetical protein